MKIRSFTEEDVEELINLIANFRITLAELKGIKKKFDLIAAKGELEYYQKNRFPIFIAEDVNGHIIGYHVCRVQDDVVWSESLYVKSEERRKGVGSALYEKAEVLAEKLGADNVYNWVHPNNHRSIPFLKKKGYNVLNLIELRKRRPNEKFNQQITVGKYIFDY